MIDIISMDYILILDIDDILVDIRLLCYKPNCSHKRLVYGEPKQLVFVHMRPGYREFLEWCISKGFGIVVFTATPERYAQAITKLIFGPLNIDVLATLNYSHLTDSSKRIDKVRSVLGYAPKVILALDDSIVANEGSNNPNDTRAIYIKPWSLEDANDNELYHIRSVIESKIT